MRIGINGYEAVIPRFGFNTEGLPNRVGSAEVCFQLLVELEKLDKTNEYIIYLPVKPSSDMPKERENWTYRVVPSKKLWTLFALPKAVRKDNLDVFFSPTHYAPFFTKCSQIIAVLDVSYKHFPNMFAKKDLYKLNMWGANSIKRAKHIITISESSKNDIIKTYKVPSSKVSVIPVGIKEMKETHMTKQDLFEKYDIASPYILFVGTLQPRKNITRLIEAYSTLDTDAQLIVVGKKGWQYEEILSAPEKYNVANKVKFLQSVTDEELPLFYKHAEVFVLPSLYEGFGLPVLEAMRYSCPVITSDVSSLPEAGGDAALYVDPKSTTDIAEKLKKVLTDKTLRSKMIEKGKEQVEKFSWEKSAKEVLDIFEKV